MEGRSIHGKEYNYTLASTLQPPTMTRDIKQQQEQKWPRKKKQIWYVINTSNMKERNHIIPNPLTSYLVLTMAAQDLTSVTTVRESPLLHASINL